MRRPSRTDNTYNEYVKDFYRKIEDYDWNDVTDNLRGLESFLHRAREKRMTDLIKKYGRGRKYLDVGCGTGLILRHLPKGSVGIDLNPRHLEKARIYAPQSQVMLGDAENIDLPVKTFSTVICTEVLEHLVWPNRALECIYKVLEPNGILIGSTPRHALLWRFRWLSSTHFHNEPFHNEYEERELRQLFASYENKLLETGFFGSNFFFVLRKR